ncbi:MAG TPA: SDR family oxidoreductase [Acidimicrobiia bacterium]|nr:SDR family oxidoreductase [Acidimicrobiia bacterium]
MTSEERQVAIVTGMSRGLGLATTRALAGIGWIVVGDARSRDELQVSVDAVDGDVRAIAGDVTDPAHREQLVRAAISAGGLDLIVNNASILGPSPQPFLDSYPLDTLEQVYRVNVLAPLALTQAVLPLLRQRRGVVVNVTSDAGRESYPGWGGYGSSKAALDQLSRVLAAEEPDISVYRFDPGDMNTRMHQEAFPGEDITDRPDPEQSVPSLLALIETRPASGGYGVEAALLTR